MDIKASARNILELPSEVKHRNINIIPGSGYIHLNQLSPLFERLGIYDANSTADILISKEVNVWKFNRDWVKVEHLFLESKKKGRRKSFIRVLTSLRSDITFVAHLGREVYFTFLGANSIASLLVTSSWVVPQGSRNKASLECVAPQPE
ncbi:hypothetical protein IEQ34_006885 [Dendrobium chrysotoxum]|uniref:Uncharacterized protein n=1 Tax=Dendrobium chrysotoxum TaxID=161865 RepID=A0AAV7GRM8_DENCH|nr:hypothetical protein IEQ34_006885 [Dendrobium chrysotoxum]